MQINLTAGDWIHVAYATGAAAFAVVGLQISRKIGAASAHLEKKISDGNNVLERKIDASNTELKGRIYSAKAEMISSQVAMQRDMDAKHAENREGLSVHVAEDRVIAKNLTGELGRLNDTVGKFDDKLDRMRD